MNNSHCTRQLTSSPTKVYTDSLTLIRGIFLIIHSKRACARAYVRACVRVCVRASVHACVLKYCACVHACMRACMRACERARVRVRTYRTRVRACVRACVIVIEVIDGRSDAGDCGPEKERTLALKREGDQSQILICYKCYTYQLILTF
jgi:hypothetical protein